MRGERGIGVQLWKACRCSRELPPGVALAGARLVCGAELQRGLAC